jgi:hypothetical protein
LSPVAIDFIEFDVAVTSSNDSGKEGGIGIKVLGSNLGGTLFKRASEQQVSRIKR